MNATRRREAELEWLRLSKEAEETGRTKIEVPSAEKKRDMALFRLMLDFDALLEATGGEGDESWYRWAEIQGAELRKHLQRKGYVV